MILGSFALRAHGAIDWRSYAGTEMKRKRLLDTTDWAEVTGG